MLDFAITMARKAGALLLDGLERRPVIELKSSFEVVTDIDRASEQLIVTAIRQQYPDHGIVAEEGTGVEPASEYLWVIDPLDGTNNYAHNFPFFAVSIGLLCNRELFAGVVFDPLRNELYSAQKGQGAFCNGRRIAVSTTTPLAAALLSTGFPYDYATATANNARQFDRIQSCTQGVRRAGAAALDLAYVAMGRLDAHWELQLKAWDSAAGALLVAEAGGRLSDWSGNDWNPWSANMIASNGHIHNELIGILSAE